MVLWKALSALNINYDFQQMTHSSIVGQELSVRARACARVRHGQPDSADNTTAFLWIIKMAPFNLNAITVWAAKGRRV